MRLLVSHFFNEELLLPWWLRHHRDFFDHGVLIDYASTDLSREIIRDLVPEWDVVESANSDFNAVKCDKEVMHYESNFNANLKIALNTTEFLNVANEGELDRIFKKKPTSYKLQGAVMVDKEPCVTADYASPLVEQKNSGFWEHQFDYSSVPRELEWPTFPTRSRIMHNFSTGRYSPGRHSTFHPSCRFISRNIASVWWYAFSPMQPNFIERKIGICSRIPEEDKLAGMGTHHSDNSKMVWNRYDFFKNYSLTLDTTFNPIRENLWILNKTMKSVLKRLTGVRDPSSFEVR